jgi:NAD(P)H-dependent FMN reductase
MAYVPKILAFGGSLRVQSFNARLVQIAAAAARQAGAEVTVLELRGLPLPVFDQDLEDRDGLPANARKLKELFAANDGLMIASPEYNSSITAALKNAIDWVSRQASPQEPSLASFAGKTAAIMSASPGGLGGLRGLVHLRAILGNIGVLVIPDQVAIATAHEAFAADGTLKDARKQASVEAIATRLVATIARLRG